MTPEVLAALLRAAGVRADEGAAAILAAALADWPLLARIVRPADEPAPPRG